MERVLVSRYRLLDPVDIRWHPGKHPRHFARVFVSAERRYSDLDPLVMSTTHQRPSAVSLQQSNTVTYHHWSFWCPMKECAKWNELSRNIHKSRNIDGLRIGQPLNIGFPDCALWGRAADNEWMMNITGPTWTSESIVWWRQWTVLDMWWGCIPRLQKEVMTRGLIWNIIWGRLFTR